jgi:hypothetical protein
MVFTQARRGSTSVSPFMVALCRVAGGTSFFAWITNSSNSMVDGEGFYAYCLFD